MVKNGFWNDFEYIDTIVECINKKELCIPEDSTNLFNCVEGHIGPLCESCDIEGKIWGSTYGTIDYMKCI